MALSLKEMLAGPRLVRAVPLPHGQDGAKVGLRVLTGAEKQAAWFEALEAFKGRGIEAQQLNSAVAVDGFSERLAAARLSRALVQPEEPHARLCSSTDEMLGLLDEVQLLALYAAYNELEEDISPNLDEMDEVKLETALAELKKKPDLANSYGSRSLRRLLVFSVLRPTT
jgi:hypothetical protein